MTKSSKSTDSAVKAALNCQRTLLVYPPAIPFAKDPATKTSDHKESRENYKTIPIELDPKDKDSSDATEWKIPVFEDGTTEDWVRWRVHFEELEAAYPLDTSSKKILFARTLLRGIAKDAFNTGVSNASSSGTTQLAAVTDNNMWEAGLGAIQA